MVTMPVDAISDQKRLVRGEYWLRARGHLRARDHVHGRAWKILIVAGPSPAEEIKAIRACMPKAHITAVDIVEANVMQAIDAGVDEAHVCDLGEVQKFTNGTGHYRKTLPTVALRDKKFDVINLDLTGPANDWLKSVVGCYFPALETKGVMMVTFSYGRDVVEAQNLEWRIMQAKAEERYPNGHYCNGSHVNSLAALGAIPPPIAIRVWYALRTRCTELESCIQYRGNKMPMVACLLAKNHALEYPADFKSLSSDDLQYAVFSEELNLSMLYACPAERIDAFRRAATRREAARKAVETRRERQSATAALEAAWNATSRDERAQWWNRFLKPKLREHLVKAGWIPPNETKAIASANIRMVGSNGREQPD